MAQQDSALFMRVRVLAERRAGNEYFRGLISKKLGPDRRLDDNDDLIDLVIESEWLRIIYDDLFRSQLGKARLYKRIEDSFPEDAPVICSDDDICKLAWELIVEDPRFDVVLKQALEEAKAPPMPVRGSALSRVSGMVERLRTALTSGVAKHSNAVLAGSVAAGLLAGSAATKVIPTIINTGASESSRLDSAGIVAAINALTTQVKEESTLQLQLIEKSDRGSQIEGRLATLEEDRVNLRRDLSKMNSRITDLQKQGEINQKIEENLASLNRFASDQIEPLIQDAKNLNIDKHLERYDQDLWNIAYDLGPYSDMNAAVTPRTRPAVSQPASGQDVHTVVTAIDAFDKRAAAYGDLASRLGAVSDYRQIVSFQKVNDTQPVTVTFGQTRCTFSLTLESISSGNAKFQIGDNVSHCPSEIKSGMTFTVRQNSKGPVNIFRQERKISVGNGESSVVDIMDVELVSLQRAHSIEFFSAPTRANIAINSEQRLLP